MAGLVAKYQADTWSALVPVTTKYGCVYRAPCKVPSRDGWQLVVGHHWSKADPEGADDFEWTWSVSLLEDDAADAALLDAGSQGDTWVSREQRFDGTLRADEALALAEACERRLDAIEELEEDV